MKRSPMRRTQFGMTKMKNARTVGSVDSIEEKTKTEALSTPIPRTPRGTYGPATLTPAAKTIQHRNQRLLALARGKPCLLNVEGVCCHDQNTVVACHSNDSRHGKAGARKADDQYTVWGCWKCHQWLDSGPGAGWVGQLAFDCAHVRQREVWAKMVGNLAVKPADRRACHWALELLSKVPQ